MKGNRTSQLELSGEKLLNPEVLFQVKLHGFLLWASIGLLMPVGVLVMRMCSRVQCGKRLKILFYSHVILEMTAVLLATGAAVLSIKNFDNSFTNTHQRMGLALYGLIWVQALIGFFRPHRGVKLRSVWYAAHWLLGTAVAVAGMVNIYVGLQAYENKSASRVRLWTAAFSGEVAALAFLYLLQDRWDYIKKQGVILGDDEKVRVMAAEAAAAAAASSSSSPKGNGKVLDLLSTMP